MAEQLESKFKVGGRDSSDSDSSEEEEEDDDGPDLFADDMALGEEASSLETLSFGSKQDAKKAVKTGITVVKTVNNMTPNSARKVPQRSEKGRKKERKNSFYPYNT